jgi:hypothetical protein
VLRVLRTLSVIGMAAAIGSGGLGCGAPAPGVPRSQQPFDQIQREVSGKSEAEVETLLGRPDAHESRLVGDEVWIWWNFTFLDGDQYSPDVRGQVVHLEITFDKPVTGADPDVPHAAWRVAGPFSVNFSRRLPRG